MWFLRLLPACVLELLDAVLLALGPLIDLLPSAGRLFFALSILAIAAAAATFQRRNP